MTTYKKVRKAVFPVGGLGTRFLPATKSMPKEMLTVVDKPLIHYAVEEARKSGIEEFIFVTGRGKSAIEDYFDNAAELDDLLNARGQHELARQLRESIPPAGQVAYTRQPEPLGLGHAVWCARNLIGDEPFAVLLADDLMRGVKPCLQFMQEAYEKTGGNVVAVMEVPPDHTPRYGIIDIGVADGAIVSVKNLVEKPKLGKAPSNLAIVGRYVLQPEIFGELEKQRQGAGGEIQLTDAIASLLGKQPVHGARFDGRRFDCGSKAGFLEANVALALENPELAADMQDIINRHARAKAA
ncbi:MAG: UTP--glucose-1-phosphate uridylyltransferase GalU [Dongiaceae bacterium]